MEMYEINYVQLRLFLGDIRSLPNRKISTVPGGIPVLLEVQEQSVHTSTILLTYCFAQSVEHDERKPDMQIRIYHDSRQAEVLSHRCRLNDEKIHAWSKTLDSMLLCRWRMNRFLFKWVKYLRRQGHSF
jgi:hypothetical protein